MVPWISAPVSTKLGYWGWQTGFGRGCRYPLCQSALLGASLFEAVWLLAGCYEFGGRLRLGKTHSLGKFNTDITTRMTEYL